MPCFYGGCIGSSIWMGSGLGCGMAVMDYVYLVWVFLFRFFSRGLSFLILLYPWVSATGLVCAVVLRRFAALRENKKNPLCEVVWVRYEINI